MPQILSLVNSISSTSIPVEIAHAVNDHTRSEVTVGVMMEEAEMDLDPDIAELDLPLVFLDGNSNFDPRPYRQLAALLHDSKYDIVHTHHNFSGAVSRLLAQLGNKIVVNTAHNDLRYFTFAQRAVNAASFMIPDVHIYNSESTKTSRGVLERGFSRRDEVIYNGVNLNRINRSSDHSLPFEVPDAFTVTNVGVMTPQKNQHAILRTARVIKDRSPTEDIHFLIAGSGPLETELQEAASELEVNDCVTFTGYLPKREQVYSLLHQSDVFLTPSMYEGFCVAAVEAMACGLPVIASDLNVFREVIGKHGIFVPRTNYTEIADRIVQSAREYGTGSDARRRKSLKKRAKNRYPLEKTASSYHALYCDLVT